MAWEKIQTKTERFSASEIVRLYNQQNRPTIGDILEGIALWGISTFALKLIMPMGYAIAVGLGLSIGHKGCF
ncbi:hypothetical protein V6C27_11225 [Peptococcaceae bacterium 1198_IL3148]